MTTTGATTTGATATGGSSPPAPGRAGFHPLTVANIERLCDDAVAVTFEVPEDLRETFAFRPGQYLTLRQDTPAGEQRRSYSICSAVGLPPKVGVRRIDGGLFSGWLVDQARPGDVVEVGPPSGSFTPRLTAGAHHGLVAAGSGITPVLSIAASVLAAHPDSRVTLIYGNRRTDTVMFAEELSDLKNQYGPRLHLLHVLSREPMEAEIFSGRLDSVKLRELLTRLVPVSSVDHWWLCGPLGMTESALEVLTELGAAPERVHRELFYVDEPPPLLRHQDDVVAADGATSEVTVVLNGRSTTLTLPRDQPVLDSAQRVRGDLPFACKGGVCGTCRALLTDGEATMRRNYALEREELAAGYVLTCQTLPVSDAVTVDYDA
ncbi:MAG TPA: 1,2-phenylacetyl-CoA epoxidase subunit PaaE [Pseudonocardia sp.]|jgi:ring-1,2-phenylacetyl-CoA epoxidase subunit PaaE|nr:1,2-phenylacetyl-CoA epoxidase subunit PaaE [Pseudonocardia sp.]